MANKTFENQDFKMTNWWDRIVPDCCEDCGNYKTFIGSTNQERPQSIRCWKSESGDCRQNSNKATYEQLRKRSPLVRNPDIGKECSICLNPMKGPYVKKIFCGHTFHHKCLKTWEEKRMSCPMCRYEYGEGPTISQLLEDYEEAIQDFKSDFYSFKSLIQTCETDEFNDSYSDLSESFNVLVVAHTAYYNRTHESRPEYIRNINRYVWALNQVENIISVG
jgi:hypothetical protein